MWQKFVGTATIALVIGGLLTWAVTPVQADDDTFLGRDLLALHGWECQPLG